MEPPSQKPPEPTDEVHFPPPDPIENIPLPRTEPQVISGTVNPYRKFFIFLGILVLLAGMATGYVLFHKTKKAVLTTPARVSTQAKVNTSATTAEGLNLDPNKNYGNKYANGILPVGDSHYVTDTAKTGYIFACAGYANNIKTAQGGAGRRGPWFTNSNTQYDLNNKLKVQGSASWQSSFSDKADGTTRTITTNDLPNHTTGVFPIAASDPAYAYDRNPNSIKPQSLTYALSVLPQYGTPLCMGGQAGVMLTGAVLFNGFDAAGRDAGAWEIQDSCGGHPEKQGEYHYHTLSSCIKDISVHTVIGFALDGFPITGPQVGPGNILTTSDLDECHGLTSQITLDGKDIARYHYVMTQDFPYSVSCFRSVPASIPGQPSAKP